MSTIRFVLVFIAATLLPLLLGIGYALLYSFGQLDLVHPGWTIKHWLVVLNGTNLWSSLLFSAYVALSSVVLALIFAFFIASYFRKSLTEKRFSYIIHWPLTLPYVVAGFVAFQLLSKAGLLSRIGYNIGLIQETKDFPQLIHDGSGLGIIFTHVFLAVPFFTLLLNNLYKSEQIEALRQISSTLGANAVQTQQRVILPVLGYKILPTALMYWIFIMGSYEIPLLLGGQRQEMLSILVLRKIQNYDLASIPEGYVIAMVYTFIVASLTVSFFLLNKKRNA